MSSRYAVLQSITTTSDLIESETRPLARVTLALEAAEESRTSMRRLLARAAYEARLAYTPEQVNQATGIPWWTLRRLVNEHLAANPSLPRPKPITAPQIIDPIELGRGATQSMSSDK